VRQGFERIEVSVKGDTGFASHSTVPSGLTVLKKKCYPIPVKKSPADFHQTQETVSDADSARCSGETG
jgi:hypothetical protein